MAVSQGKTIEQVASQGMSSGLTNVTSISARLTNIVPWKKNFLENLSHVVNNDHVCVNVLIQWFSLRSWSRVYCLPWSSLQTTITSVLVGHIFLNARHPWSGQSGLFSSLFLSIFFLVSTVYFHLFPLIFFVSARSILIYFIFRPISACISFLSRDLYFLSTFHPFT